MTLVTIGIPTVKRLEYLREAVASALEQTYTEIEVLIGQDPGPEGPDLSVRNWCLTIAAADKRVRYQLNERTLGLAGNWNALAGSARGSFLAIIGDDDRLAPTFVARLVESGEGCDVTFCNHHVIDAGGSRVPGEGAAFAQRYARDRLPAGAVLEPERVAWRGSIPMSAALVRTESARAFAFLEDLNTPEMEFFIRLARAGGRFCFVPDYLAEYRVHGNSATASGLRVEQLVQHLIAVKVAPDVESDKEATLRALLPTAVGRCVEVGKPALARRLFFDHYYPRRERFRPRGIAQVASMLLPASIGTRVYTLLRGFSAKSKP